MHLTHSSWLPSTPPPQKKNQTFPYKGLPHRFPSSHFYETRPIKTSSRNQSFMILANTHYLHASLNMVAPGFGMFAFSID